MSKILIIAMLLGVSLAGPGFASDKANETSAAKTSDQAGAKDKAESAEMMWFYVKCKVFDRFGVPTPNVRITAVAVDKKGQPHGPYSTWTMARTSADGQSNFGMSGALEVKPGKLQIVAKHPSIGEVHRTVEWTDLLYTSQAATTKAPQFVLRAKGGIGLKAWREKAAKEALRLVAALEKAEKTDQIESLTKQIVDQEMMAVPALAEALEDFDNPKRPRFVKALTWTWNACMGIGPLDKKFKAKARAIYNVDMAVRNLLRKPRSGLQFRGRIGKWPREYTTYAMKEMEWLISRWRAQAVEAKKNGNVNEVATLKWKIKKFEDHLAEMKKVLASMPTSAPATTMPK